MAHSHHHHMRLHVRDDTQHLGSLASAASRTIQQVARANPVLFARDDPQCTSNSEPGCTKPTQVPTLAIALAVIVPVVGISVVLAFLHRRNKQKLREEDQRDKYKSNDWGMEGVTPKAGKKGGPEMTISEKEIAGHDRGLSIETGSPYILPVGLHGSRESFHSLSRSQHDPHDPYGPVAHLRDDQSFRSSTRGAYKADTGSMHTASSAGTRKEGLQAGLLQNAQRMSTSIPIRSESLSPDGSRSPDSKFIESGIPLSPLNPRYEPEAPSASPAPAPTPAPAASPSEPVTQHASVKPMSVPTISIPEPPIAEKQVNKSPVQTSNNIPTLPRVQSQAVVLENTNTHSIISTSSYGDGFEVTPPSPRNSDQPAIVAPKPRYSTGPQNVGLGVDDFARNNNRLSMSLRPMPAEDPMENPEERANRIRSFYKEYFDESKPEPAGGHLYADYVEDYGSEYQDGAVFDPRTGNFVVAQPNAPFAEPITRRAMTPPPRAPPRFRSNTATGPRPPHMSNGSMASSHYQPPRNMSSMSGRLPPQMRKPLPPPAALSSLPTPAKLNENSMVFDAADFAPPVSFRERQNGMRPDSPLGNARPYSPSVRPHTPLVGSYDELPVLPSPHLMRKSGTFTALDFAPPSRIRDPAGPGSDAGSIRSNRSGISAAGRFAVRSGANRVSRIPREIMGTKDDLALQLRPRMNMVTNA